MKEDLKRRLWAIGFSVLALFFAMPMAAAMGIVGGDEEAILEVLSGITEEEVARAEVFASEKVQVTLKDTPKKLYIEVLLYTEDDSSAVKMRIPISRRLCTGAPRFMTEVAAKSFRKGRATRAA